MAPISTPETSFSAPRPAAPRRRKAPPSLRAKAAAEWLVTQLSDIIRPTQFRGSDGELAGFRVYPGRNRQKFAALGLRPGDLIKDINGQPLNDPTQAMQVFQSLGDTDEVTVTIERNGQDQSLVLNTSQLDLDEESTQ